VISVLDLKAKLTKNYIKMGTSSKGKFAAKKFLKTNFFSEQPIRGDGEFQVL